MLHSSTPRPRSCLCPFAPTSVRTRCIFPKTSIFCLETRTSPSFSVSCRHIQTLTPSTDSLGTFSHTAVPRNATTRPSPHCTFTHSTSTDPSRKSPSKATSFSFSLINILLYYLASHLPLYMSCPIRPSQSIQSHPSWTSRFTRTPATLWSTWATPDSCLTPPTPLSQPRPALASSHNLGGSTVRTLEVTRPHPPTSPANSAKVPSLACGPLVILVPATGPRVDLRRLLLACPSQLLRQLQLSVETHRRRRPQTRQAPSKWSI